MRLTTKCVESIFGQNFFWVLGGLCMRTTRVSKKELKQLAVDVGAELTSEGPRWTATFPDTKSLFMPGSNVTLSGTRQDLGRSLRQIKRWEDKKRESQTVQPEG